MAKYIPLETSPHDDASSVDAEMARFIRAEVRAAVQDHVQETLTSPPSYDSSDPLLLGNNNDTEAQIPTTTEAVKPPPSFKETCEGLAYAMLFLAPFGLFPLLILTGKDPLMFSLMAFSMEVAMMFFVVFLIALVAVEKAVVEKFKSIRWITELSEAQTGPLAVGRVFVVFWGFWLTFFGICWFWSGWEEVDVVAKQKTWMQFHEKIDTPGALKHLAKCLQDALPERNATISDFDVCLRAMGMNETSPGAV